MNLNSPLLFLQGQSYQRLVYNTFPPTREKNQGHQFFSTSPSHSGAKKFRIGNRAAVCRIHSPPGQSVTAYNLFITFSHFIFPISFYFPLCLFSVLLSVNLISFHAPWRKENVAWFYPFHGMQLKFFFSFCGKKKFSLQGSFNVILFFFLQSLRFRTVITNRRCKFDGDFRHYILSRSAAFEVSKYMNHKKQTMRLCVCANKVFFF